jgi:hypothetical protein
MFAKKKKVSEEEKLIAKKFFDEMEVVSKELVQALNTMERRINVVDGGEIDAL